MFAAFLEELGIRGISVLFGMVVGGIVTLLLARWRRIRERLKILSGDARDTVVIAHHLLETVEEPAAAAQPARRVPKTLRIRTLGQSQLKNVVPNGHLGFVLMRRAARVGGLSTLIAMDGPEGSYLLETLTNYVSDCTANAPFEHDLYVLAPCCEHKDLVEHQPITILVIRLADLPLLEDWPTCRAIEVEHSADGARLLTLREMALRFRAEQERLATMKRDGKRTRHLETMYVLDLALDRRTANAPVHPVAWDRYTSVLKALKLE